MRYEAPDEFSYLEFIEDERCHSLAQLALVRSRLSHGSGSGAEADHLADLIRSSVAFYFVDDVLAVDIDHVLAFRLVEGQNLAHSLERVQDGGISGVVLRESTSTISTCGNTESNNFNAQSENLSHLELLNEPVHNL